MDKLKKDKKYHYFISAFVLTIAITFLGALMMTVNSSPQMKGAAFLWLPAALQLIAGVWLGPIMGFFVGGIGAYAAGIIAYGGWGLADIIINPIAGGVANSMLPGILFRIFRINPTFGVKQPNVKRAVINVFWLLLAVTLLAVFLLVIKIYYWAYIPPILLLLLAPNFLTDLTIEYKKDFITAFFICIFICLSSALIGSFGSVVAGSTWKDALLKTGLGWFLGDTGSCLLGLYLLAYFSGDARKLGISKI
jgi:hypothetical protein